MVPNAKGLGYDFLAVFQFTSAAFVSSQNQEASEHSNLALEGGGVIKIQLAWPSKHKKRMRIAFEGKGMGGHKAPCWLGPQKQNCGHPQWSFPWSGMFW